jgi:hypothetical protein
MIESDNEFREEEEGEKEQTGFGLVGPSSVFCIHP